MGYSMLSRTKNFVSTFIAVAIGVAIMPMTSFAADVDVYAEGAYTESQLDIYIYANINAAPILSFGVKVNYPAGLTFTGATKNEDVWFFGNGTAQFSYMDPTDDGSGVVIIGGKLDTANSMAGVTGTRVLLGTASFTHSGMTNFSGVSITYGRGDGTGSYTNFVATNGTIYDGGGVGFAVAIWARGDGNADGAISTTDYIAIRNNIGRTDAPPWIDCNGDGKVSTTDYVCVRNSM